MDFNTSTGVSVHSNILSARVEAGYNLLPNPEGKRALQVTPFVAIAPTQIRQNGTKESFGDLGAGFNYGSNTNTALPVSLGMEVSGDLQLGNKELLRSFLRMSWVHDLKSSSTMAGAYNPSSGPTIYSNGSPSMGDMFVIKGGAKYYLGNKISAYATVDLELGNDADSFRGIGGSLGAMYSW
jgi:outer membrane autotransporter protein